MKSIMTKVMTGLSALALTASMAACSAHPGVALKVGDEVFTEADLDVASSQYEMIQGKTPKRLSLLNAIPLWVHADEMAKLLDLNISDEDLVKELEQLKAAGKVQDYPQNPNKVIKLLVKYSMIGHEASERIAENPSLQTEIESKMAQLVTETPVVISPRYPSVEGDVVGSIALVGDVVRGTGN